MGVDVDWVGEAVENLIFRGSFGDCSRRISWVYLFLAMVDLLCRVKARHLSN